MVVTGDSAEGWHCKIWGISFSTEEGSTNYKGIGFIDLFISHTLQL
jgi:hypothetical protein